MTTRMTLKADGGNLGIGTTSPVTYKVHAYGTGSLLKLESTGNYSEIQLANSGHTSYIGDYSDGIRFYSNSGSTPTLTIGPGAPGNVGVGRAPSYKFDVNGSSRLSGGAYMDRQNATGTGINWYSNGYTAWTEYMASPTATGCGPTANITAPSGTFVTSWALRSFIENATGYGWTFESGTSNQTTPSVVAEIRASDGRIWTGGAIYAGGDIISSYSDIRLKTVLGKIERAVDKIRAIDTFYYKPNELALKLGAEPGRKVGVSAQSVEAVAPEVVSNSALDQEYKTVQYERLVPLLIEAVKEQQTTIERQQAQIDMLMKKLGLE
jgi:hypothetical protein